MNMARRLTQNASAELTDVAANPASRLRGGMQSRLKISAWS